jgi:hypothetical protein
MIYQKHNFNESFSNATGDTRNRMSIFQLGKTITKHPKEIISAIADADVKINENANKRQIIKTILNNKRNKQMIQNISAIIFASSSFDGNYSNADEDATTGTEKGKVMAQIGAFFKSGKERRTKRRAEREASGKPSVFEKIGSFFSKNKEDITTISASLYDGLQTKRGENVLITESGGDGSGDAQPSFFAKNKFYIIGAIVIVGGFFAYKYYAKKK